MPDRGIENRTLNAVRAQARSPMKSARRRWRVAGRSRAVEAARKTGFAGDITLIGAERHLPYDRPPLSKEFLEATEPGVEATDSVLPQRRRIRRRARRGASSRRAGNGSGRCAARSCTSGDRQIGYDALVIATGSQLRTLPGTEHMDGVHGLRTLEDSLASVPLWTQVHAPSSSVPDSSDRKSLLEPGNGVVDVTVVEALPTPLVRAAGAEMGAAIASLHERNGTTLLCGRGVAAVEGDGRVERVVLNDGTVHRRGPGGGGHRGIPERRAGSRARV